MSNFKIKHFLFLQIFVLLGALVVSCNSKDKDQEVEIVVTPAIVAVKQFRLAKNDSVIAKLDSLAFAIDLDNGVIFNPDSLPKGTKIDKLVASITFANSMSKAELKFKSVSGNDTTVNYLKNPDDSINFTSPVILDVTAQNGVNSFSYVIKVNVHQQNPDAIVWRELESNRLPSRFDNPVAQHTVIQDKTVYCLVEEYNGSYTVAASSDLNDNSWEKSIFSPGFVPMIDSFTATSKTFYILDENGSLYESTDLSEWQPANQTWLSILGAYDEGILGIKESSSEFWSVYYPASPLFPEMRLSEDFPIQNSSSLGIIQTEWSDVPTAILACGTTATGDPSSEVWAFDGTTWAAINQNELPSLENPMLARYVTYRDTPYVFTQREFDVWMIVGGILENGEINRNIYMSYDNGVHWSLAPDSMQLSQNIPPLEDADIIVTGYALSADISDQWEKPATRVDYTIDGYEVTWICPYMYIFGGFLNYPETYLNTDIYRGVLERLRFIPAI